MNCSVGLPRFLEQVVLLWARLQLSSFLARFFGERDQPVFQSGSLLETTPRYHGAAPLLELAGAQRAFSSPIIATGLAVMVVNVSEAGGFLNTTELILELGSGAPRAIVPQATMRRGALSRCHDRRE